MTRRNKDNMLRQRKDVEHGTWRDRYINPDVLWRKLAARVIQRAEGQKVIVSRVDRRDGRLGTLQLCLAEFHD